jgi:hypothetical protein
MTKHSHGALAYILAGLVLLPCAQAIAAPNLFARVNAAGTLVAGSEVTSVTHLATGIYEVTFTRVVSQCAFVATTANAYSQALTVFTAGGHASANGVYVETKNQGGGLTDGPFELVVDCGLNGMKYAVVDYAGTLVRSTAGATLTMVGTGQYNVTFPSSVKNCAYLATVGDPANALVFNPSGVYTGSGPNINTVYVETKNPGGGLQPGVPFHLAVICSNTHSRFAVVEDSGLIKRGATLTGSFRPTAGEYVIVANTTVLPNCATVATRGSVNASVPFTPATVELIAGPATNTRAVQVRELLFFGGALTNQDFHAAVVCR